MSRKRNNYVTDRKLLPQDINYITNLTEQNLSVDQQNTSNSIGNLDKSEINKKIDGNVLFFKKPKFIGTPKEYSNKENPTVLNFTNYFFLLKQIILLNDEKFSNFIFTKEPI